MRRLSKLLGSVLIVAALLVGTWVVVVWLWQDPFTAWYTHREQAKLAKAYALRVETFTSKPEPAPAAVFPRAQVERLAAAYERSLREGGPVGRLQIKRLGLNMIVVDGTDDETLKKGPGRYLQSGVPGQGKLIYVAGHRTTYLAPFAHIDAIRNGDQIVFQVPYGTFIYRAYRHYIVPATALSVLVNHGREILRLQACHPRFFATHRYLVDARLVAFRASGSSRTISVRQT